MNKKTLSLIAAGSLLVTTALPLQGCYGSFGLTHKLYKWNGSLGDKWINSLVMVAFCIVPIYDITLFADGVVFNTIEFWTGSNPVTMAPGEKDTRTVSLNGKTFVVTATKNRLDLVPVEKGVQTMSVVFDPKQESWYVVSQGEKRLIGEQDNDVLTLLYPDGHHEKLTR